MQTFTLACFWVGTLLFVWSAWLNWRSYKRWQRLYKILLAEDYLREFLEED